MSPSGPIRVVLDTSVLVAAARSRQGASYTIVSAIPARDFQPCLSVGLYAERQEVLTRPGNLPPGLTGDDVVRFLRYLGSQAHLQETHFLWRPFLPDADDDMVLELALAARLPVYKNLQRGGLSRRRAARHQDRFSQSIPEVDTHQAKSALTIQLPESLQKSIEAVAAEEGYRVSQFLASAAGEKLAAMPTMEYLRREAGGIRIARSATFACCIM